HPPFPDSRTGALQGGPRLADRRGGAAPDRGRLRPVRPVRPAHQSPRRGRARHPAGAGGRAGSPFVYDRVQLLDTSCVGQWQDSGYVRDVLTALGIRYGPAHTEVMLTAAGPCLIETGARLNGADAPELCRDCTGQDQVALTVEACLDAA